MLQRTCWLDPTQHIASNQNGAAKLRVALFAHGKLAKFWGNLGELQTAQKETPVNARFSIFWRVSLKLNNLYTR